MKAFRVKSAEFVSTPNPQEPLVKTVLLSLPSGSGWVFGLVKVLGKTDEVRTQIAQAVTEHVKRLHDTLGKNVNVPRRFEQVLQAINEDIARITSESRPVPITDMHAVVGIVYKNQIFLSGCGRLHALFMHRTAKQRYVLYELDDQFQEIDKQKWNKLFLTVLDGELHHGDVFYAATRVSAHEINLADLQDTIITLPPSGALKRIHQHLHTDTPYGAVCFRVSDIPKTGKPKKTNPLTSIEHLGKTRDNTADLLGEQSPDVGGTISKFINPLLKKLSAPGTQGPKSTFKKITSLLLRLSMLIAGAAAKFASSAFKILSGLLTRALALVKNKDKRTSVKKSVQQKSKRVQTTYKKLPKTAKIAVPVVILIVVFMIVVLSISAKQKVIRESRAEYEAVITRVEEKTNAAEAALIYNDASQARSLLEESASLMETIPSDAPAEQNQIEELQQKIATLFNELRGVITAETTVLVNISDSGLPSGISNLVNAGGVLYAVTDDNSLLRYRSLEQDVLREEPSVGAISRIVHTTPHENGFLFTDDSQRLGRANVTQSSLTSVVSGTEAVGSVEDISVYNGNLYTLSAQDRQIVKMRPQGDGFEAGTNWIDSADSDLRMAVSMAIDGDIWVLTKQKVVKFTSGLEQSFTHEEVNPAFSNPTHIWTELDHNEIYILEPEHERVIVFNKDGNLLAQYTNPAFANATDMVVRPEKSQIFISTNKELLQFTMTHTLN